MASNSPSKKPIRFSTQLAPIPSTPQPEADELGRLMHAVYFAAVRHRHQRRKDVQQTPYINHPLGGACLAKQNKEKKN
jgi:(p)ppGpp synthase/HD superfamily hydrolase